MQSIDNARQILLAQVADSQTPREVLKAKELKDLYSKIASIDPAERAAFGKNVNGLKNDLEAAIAAREAALQDATVVAIDVTAPWDINSSQPDLLPTEYGTRHPLTKELDVVIDIFTRMGFEAIESRQIDDDFHMFGALNFPENHPARDGYDTFRTEEDFIPPAHTSTMQHRVFKERQGET